MRGSPISSGSPGPRPHHDEVGGVGRIPIVHATDADLRAERTQLMSDHRRERVFDVDHQYSSTGHFRENSGAGRRAVQPSGALPAAQPRNRLWRTGRGEHDPPPGEGDGCRDTGPRYVHGHDDPPSYPSGCGSVTPSRTVGRVLGGGRDLSRPPQNLYSLHTDAGRALVAASMPVARTASRRGR